MIKSIKKIGLILLGNILCASATAFFIIPGGFISGGVTGFALAFEQFFGLPVQFGIAILSVALLLLGWIFLGKRFAVNSALSALCYPALVWLFKILSGFFDFSTDNIFLNLAFGAILLGNGAALIMRQGASSGGLDTIALILNKKRGISISFVINILEIIAMATQIFYSSPEEIMGGILMTLVYSALINHMLAKGVARIQVLVYSKQYEQIHDFVANTLERGCTLFRVQGGHTREDTFVLQTVISNRELFRLKEYIHKVDPVAFITISEVSEVGGRGFSLDKNAPDK